MARIGQLWRVQRLYSILKTTSSKRGRMSLVQRRLQYSRHKWAKSFLSSIRKSSGRSVSSGRNHQGFVYPEIMGRTLTLSTLQRMSEALSSERLRSKKLLDSARSILIKTYRTSRNWAILGFLQTSTRNDEEAVRARLEKELSLRTTGRTRCGHQSYPSFVSRKEILM